MATEDAEMKVLLSNLVRLLNYVEVGVLGLGVELPDTTEGQVALEWLASRARNVLATLDQTIKSYERPERKRSDFQFY